MNGTFPCFYHGDKPCSQNENCCLVTELVTLKKTMHAVLLRNKATVEEKHLAEHIVTGIAGHLVRMDELVDDLRAKIACWKRENPGCCGGMMPTCQENGCMEVSNR